MHSRCHYPSCGRLTWGYSNSIMKKKHSDSCSVTNLLYSSHFFRIVWGTAVILIQNMQCIIFTSYVSHLYIPHDYLNMKKFHHHQLRVHRLLFHHSSSATYIIMHNYLFCTWFVYFLVLTYLQNFLRNRCHPEIIHAMLIILTLHFLLLYLITTWIWSWIIISWDNIIICHFIAQTLYPIKM